jgi:hypothetical protein
MLNIFLGGRPTDLMSRHNIESVGLPPRKISIFLRPVKDDLGLRTPGIYSISCECGQVYIGQTGRSIDTRLKEHQRHIRLEYPDKSAVAEHCINLRQCTQLHNTSILATKTGYMDRVITEANEMSSIPTIRTGRMVSV